MPEHLFVDTDHEIGWACEWVNLEVGPPFPVTALGSKWTFPTALGPDCRSCTIKISVLASGSFRVIYSTAIKSTENQAENWARAKLAVLRLKAQGWCLLDTSLLGHCNESALAISSLVDMLLELWVLGKGLKGSYTAPVSDTSSLFCFQWVETFSNSLNNL